MTVVLAQQLALAEPAAVQVVTIDRDTSDELLTRWGHYLGPCGGGTWTRARSKGDPAGGPKARWGWWYTP